LQVFILLELAVLYVAPLVTTKEKPVLVPSTGRLEMVWRHF